MADALPTTSTGMADALPTITLELNKAAKATAAILNQPIAIPPFPLSSADLRLWPNSTVCRNAGLRLLSGA
jgi:hypothetical protein